MTGEPAARGHHRAVDGRAFWWTAALIFLVNAAVTAGEDRGVIALLQTLTAMWAVVAGVTAGESRNSGQEDQDLR